ncbi:MAG: carboxypeptidase-like regulatory domain-containing protein [bacterium]
MMKKAITFMLFLFSFICNGQINMIEGRVIDAKSGEALSYANISVSNKKIGTTSDQDGKFNFQADKLESNDTLIISYVGYQSKKIRINPMDDNVIALTPRMQFLDEIIVSPSTESKERIINKFRKRNCVILRTNKHPGSDEYWLPYRPQEPAIEALYFCNNENTISGNVIKKVNIFVANVKDSSSFRLRILSASDNKIPDKDMLTENIIITVTEENELVEVDLERFNLVIPENGIFVGFELLVIPENQFKLELPDGSGTYTQYSPFLQYFKVDQPKYDRWIYTKGEWTKHTQTRELSEKRKKLFMPAISLLLGH